jgi:hypothetical protein
VARPWRLPKLLAEAAVHYGDPNRSVNGGAPARWRRSPSLVTTIRTDKRSGATGGLLSALLA